MRAEAIVPDLPLPTRARSAGDASAFARALDGAGSALDRAENAEDAFAAGNGDLQTAVYERARADVVLAVATAAAQRTAQALQSILNMQV